MHAKEASSVRLLDLRGSPLRWRLVPAIDTVPAIVGFARTIPGRLCLGALFLLIWTSFSFSLFSYHIGWPQCVLLAIALFLPAPPDMRLGLAGFWFGLTVPFNFPFTAKNISLQKEAAAVTQELALTSTVNPFVFRLLTILASVAIAYAAHRALSRKKTAFPILWLFAVSAGLIILSLQLPLSSPAAPWLWGLTYHFTLMLVPVALLQEPKAPPRKRDNRRFLSFSLLTHLSMSFVVMAQSPRALELKRGSAEEARIRLKGIKVLAWAKLLSVASELWWAWIFGAEAMAGIPAWLEERSLRWPNYALIGSESFRGFHLPAWKIWVILLSNLLCYLAKVGWHLGFLVAIYRMCGAYVPRGMCRPLLAKNFLDYFRRTMFFYTETMASLFYFPAAEALAKRRALNLPFKLLALLFSVVLGGFIFHLSLQSLYFVFFGWQRTLQVYARFLLYFSAVLVACALSAVIPLRHSRKRRLPMALTGPLMLILHAVLFALIPADLDEPLSSRIAFLASLIPGMHFLP